MIDISHSFVKAAKADLKRSRRLLSRFIFAQAMLQASVFSSDLFHLISQWAIFFLKVSSSHGNLILFDSSCVPWSFGCVVVLLSPCPVFLIFQVIRHKHLQIINIRLRLTLETDIGICWNQRHKQIDICKGFKKTDLPKPEHTFVLKWKPETSESTLQTVKQEVKPE